MKGRLKIHFGYAAGTGKTYSMLEAARQLKNKGTDLVVGYVEPHARPETLALLEGLEQIEPRTVLHNGIETREPDLDRILKRRPGTVLIDELAHTNADKSRHEKRWQDIQELLDAGIDVMTTLNVQHLESLADQVASITGIVVRERVPDKVFDEADKIVLADIEPKDLLTRFEEGKVYRPVQAKAAMEHFFQEDKLEALRQIALSHVAEHIEQKKSTPSKEKVLVCIGPSPTNPKCIRAASRLAKSLHAGLLALHVENPETGPLPEKEQKQLEENTKLAKSLGATVDTVTGDDTAAWLAAYAKESGCTRLVLGRSGNRRHRLVDKVMALAPELDIYIIPDEKTMPHRQKKKSRFTLAQLYQTVLCVAAATVLNAVLFSVDISGANLATIYLLSVVVCAWWTKSPVCPVLASIANTILFNIFFVEPRFLLDLSRAQYLITFVVMLVSGLITSRLTTGMEEAATENAKRAWQARLLFEANQAFQKAGSAKEINETGLSQLHHLLKCPILFYEEKDGSLLPPVTIGEAQQGNSEREQAVALWCLHNNRQAGRGTSNLPDAKCRYYAIRQGDDVFGVVGLFKPEAASLDSAILLSLLGEWAMARKLLQERRQREKAKVEAETERLRADLLRSISHDLRTPLTSIAGSAQLLQSGMDKLTDTQKESLVNGIVQESDWLSGLVENLLTVTRLEEGGSLDMEPELLEDVAQEATRRIHTDRDIEIKTEGTPVACMNGPLVCQVITNLLDNAVHYAAGNIEIEIAEDPDSVTCKVKDEGPGIEDTEKARIFERFHTGGMKRPDGSRSLGLGLALCKSIIEAHGGTIEVTDNVPKGTVFTFTLPKERSAHAEDPAR